MYVDPGQAHSCAYYPYCTYSVRQKLIIRQKLTKVLISATMALFEHGLAAKQRRAQVAVRAVEQPGGGLMTPLGPRENPR